LSELVGYFVACAVASHETDCMKQKRYIVNADAEEVSAKDNPSHGMTSEKNENAERERTKHAD
jgi:hypothetical protein